MAASLSNTENKKIQSYQRLILDSIDRSSNVTALEDLAADLESGRASTARICRDLRIIAMAQRTLNARTDEDAKILAPVVGLYSAAQRLVTDEEKKRGIDSRATSRAHYKSTSHAHGAEEQDSCSSSMKRAREIAMEGNNVMSTKAAAKKTYPKKNKPRTDENSILDFHSVIEAVLGKRNVATPLSPQDVIRVFGHAQLAERLHRGDMQRYLIDKKLVPVASEASMRKLLIKYKDDPQSAPDSWANKGRPPIVNAKSFVDACKQKLQEKGDETWTEQDTEEMLVDFQKKRFRSRGKVQEEATVSLKCLKTYHALSLLDSAATNGNNGRDMSPQSL